VEEDRPDQLGLGDQEGQVSCEGVTEDEGGSVGAATPVAGAALEAGVEGTVGEEVAAEEAGLVRRLVLSVTITGKATATRPTASSSTRPI